MSNAAPVQPASPAAQAVASHQAVCVKDYTAPGTGLHQTIGYLIGLIALALTGFVLIFATFGVGLLIALLVHFSNQKKMKAKLHGSALQLGPNQFPDVYKMVQQTAAAMQMKTVPEVYIYEDNTQNAGAAKVRGKKILLLTDDMVYGAMTTKDARVLQFIIAHELAHHELGHSGLFRSYVSTAYKTLSRLDEFTCDGVAAAVVQNQAASAKALALLSVGPQLLPKVNIDGLIEQAKQVAANKQSKKSEAGLSHPLLLRRFARVMGVTMKV
jgi:Zn-dependent protease with chaperone function